MCINLPQIQGIFLHGVHKHALGFGLIFPLLERDETRFSIDYIVFPDYLLILQRNLSFAVFAVSHEPSGA